MFKLKKLARNRVASGPFIILTIHCAEQVHGPLVFQPDSTSGSQRVPTFLAAYITPAKIVLHHCIPSADLYISTIASSSAISSGLRLRRAMTRRMTLVS